MKSATLILAIAAGTFIGGMAVVGSIVGLNAYQEHQKSAASISFSSKQGVDVPISQKCISEQRDVSTLMAAQEQLAKDFADNKARYNPPGADNPALKAQFLKNVTALSMRKTALGMQMNDAQRALNVCLLVE